MTDFCKKKPSFSISKKTMTFRLLIAFSHKNMKYTLQITLFCDKIGM